MPTARPTATAATATPPRGAGGTRAAMSDRPSGSLTDRGLRAIKWNYIGTIGRALAQLLSLVALARLLGPEPTGLFGYALLLISFTALATDMGLSAALVQAATLSREQLGNAVSRLLLVATAACALILLLADPIARHLFGAPESAPVLRAIAPSLIVSALSVPPAALLRRELQFRALTLTGLGSYVFGYLIVGIGLAWAGAGVWALVAAWYAQNITGCIAMHRIVRNSLPLGNPLHLPGLGGFGGVIMVTYLFNWVIDNATPFVVGRSFGPTALGAFNVSNNLVRTPASHLVTNLQAVLFPASARVQDNPAALRRAYLMALAGVGFVAIPLFAGAAVASDLVVGALLGHQWAIAQPLLAPLALAMIPHSLMAISGPMLGGKGEPLAELYVQATTAVLLLLALFAAASFGLLALAWVVSGVYAVRCVGMTLTLAQRIGVGVGDLFSALRGGLVLASVAMAVAAGIEHLLAPTPLPVTLRLAIVITGIVFACVALLLALPALCLDQRLAWLALKLLGQRAFAQRSPLLRRFMAYLSSAQAS